MKKVLIFSFIIFSFSILHAQESRFQTGVMVGTHISYSNNEYHMMLIRNPLFHYSIGFVGRYKLKTNLKDLGIKTRVPLGKGVLALDFGLNLISTGYGYQLSSFDRFQRQTMFEFPLMIVLWDEKSPLMKRKWHRKRQSTYGRMGFIPSYLKNGIVDQHFTEGDATIYEQAEFGGFNLSWSYSLGFRKEVQKANTICIELGINYNLFCTTYGTIEYQNPNTNEYLEFSNRNSYIFLRCLYLFKSDIYRTVPSRIIHNPRLIE